jgi:hypothetical protein
MPVWPGAAPRLIVPSGQRGGGGRRCRRFRAAAATLSGCCGWQEQGQDNRDDRHATRTILQRSEPPHHSRALLVLTGGIGIFASWIPT